MHAPIKIQQTETLSGNQYTLKKITFDYITQDGTKETKTQEVYDIGNAATVLLYNSEQKTVLLTQQFRLPTFVDGNPDGMLIETCAGKIDDRESAEVCIKREIKEETGYEVPAVQKIFEAYMSPGTVAELIHFFIAAYTPAMKVAEGGGLEEEQEELKVMEFSFEKALQMTKDGTIKDAKTILLLLYAQANHLI